jgi:hypothetical protein
MNAKFAGVKKEANRRPAKVKQNEQLLYEQRPKRREPLTIGSRRLFDMSIIRLD